jgi:hypothetical protein
MTTAHAGAAQHQLGGEQEGKIRRKDCPTTPRDEQTTKLETKAMVAGHLKKIIVQQSPRANRRVTDGRKGDHE